MRDAKRETGSGPKRFIHVSNNNREVGGLKIIYQTSPEYSHPVQDNLFSRLETDGTSISNLHQNTAKIENEWLYVRHPFSAASEFS